MTMQNNNKKRMQITNKRARRGLVPASAKGGRQPWIQNEAHTGMGICRLSKRSLRILVLLYLSILIWSS